MYCVRHLFLSSEFLFTAILLSSFYILSLTLPPLPLSFTLAFTFSFSLYHSHSLRFPFLPSLSSIPLYLSHSLTIPLYLSIYLTHYPSIPLHIYVTCSAPTPSPFPSTYFSLVLPISVYLPPHTSLPQIHTHIGLHSSP